MLFNSVSFAIFFPVVTILYFFLAHPYRWALLLTASCFFYMVFQPVYILILAFMIVNDYVAAIQIEKSTTTARKKIFLVLSILINVMVLGFFKYYGFFNELVSDMIPHEGNELLFPVMSFILPI